MTAATSCADVSSGEDELDAAIDAAIDGVPSGVTHDASDVRNAERLVEWFGQDLRFVGKWKKWLTWSGTRWELDDQGAALRCAVQTARMMLEEATRESARAKAAFEEVRTLDNEDPARMKAEKTLERAKDACAHAIRSQNSRALEAMLHVAGAFKTIAIGYEELDADPWLFNVANGTLDLRRGELRPHRREDLITKRSAVAFDSHATCPRWDAFLERAMGGDCELVTYLQRLAGYSLTGETREHVLVFSFGVGANGKSTAHGILGDVFGDYGVAASRGLLFRAKGERHPTSLATLLGRRFVTLAEIEQGASFDEALVKDLTGGDVINARRMREDEWTFQPTHKLFMSGNYKPGVRGDDEGIWRRIRLVPWTVVIPEAERDKLLRDKLRAELPGILAWCVRGCLAWQAHGLGDPPAVVAATAEYRSSSDAVGQFFDACLTFEPHGRMLRAALRARYEGWCREEGYENPIGPRKLAERLRAHGVTNGSVRTEHGARDAWVGVREATPSELATRALRRDVGTCRDTTDHYQPPARARPHTGSGKRNPGTTSPDVTTDDEAPFDEWVRTEVQS